MGKTKQLFTNWRIIFLLVLLVFAVVAMKPSPFAEGVTIKAVLKNSSAAIAGISNPKPTATPLAKERIISMNNVPILSVEDYYEFMGELTPNRTVQIQTNKGLYKLLTKEAFEEITSNETETITIEEVVQENQTINGTTVVINKTAVKTEEVPITARKSLGMEDLGLSIGETPKSNIRKGLDLQGGTRVLLKPAQKINQSLFPILIDNMKERLNVYGLSDVVVTEVRDKPAFLGEGESFILVEIAGVTEEEVKNLLAKQGKFEAKIGDETVFKGGQDITYVCRTAECSGINPNQPCGQYEGGWACGFMFGISLSPEAAQRQADITSQYPLESRDGGSYLSEPLVLLLDDQEVSRLNIAGDLKGRATTEIAITGSEIGINQQEATFAALDEMKKLQTVLITGSLPVKIEIVKTDTISPKLGVEFVRNALLVGALAILTVSLIIFIRYRQIRLAVPIVFTSLSEVVLLLGFAALVGWNIDLAAVAGIIIAVGTGVDHLIIITDETLRGEAAYGGWKEKFKRAFFIITSAYFTTVVAMVPLMFAGAGLLKGFALITIAGLSFGVFVARPAYAAMVEILTS